MLFVSHMQADDITVFEDLRSFLAIYPTTSANGSSHGITFVRTDGARRPDDWPEYKLSKEFQSRS